MILSSMIYPTLDLEKKLWTKGFVNVVGIDEAGRGPLAGPVVAGAVIIHNVEQVVPSVRDSKKMTEKQRNVAFEKITDLSSAWGVGIVDNIFIDEKGIQLAVKTAMIKAIDQIKLKYPNINYLIVDGKNVSTIEGYKMMKITKGDLNHYSIAAGSVLAKVTRDRIMKEYSIKYPEYGFDKHVGYGTKKHIELLRNYGLTSIHRKTFIHI